MMSNVRAHGIRTARERQQFLSIIDQAYNRRSWHGTNLRGAIRGVSAHQASWRPGSKRHNIHELVVHAAYWKYAVWRRLSGQPRGSFPLDGSNWFDRSDSTDERQWKTDVVLLDRMHRALRSAVAGLPTGRLDPFLLSGIAAHDLYHAGQIQLLKKLSKARA